jgi:CRISPR-associated exonuclease Cas4
MWAENRFTPRDRSSILRRMSRRRRGRGVRRVTALPLASRRLGIAGVADLVEFQADVGGETPYPVEFKRGKAKLHRADEVQLCAQGLCLEEMTGRPVPEGPCFMQRPSDASWFLRRRLRTLTEATVERLREFFATGRTPPAIPGRSLPRLFAPRSLPPRGRCARPALGATHDRRASQGRGRVKRLLNTLYVSTRGPVQEGRGKSCRRGGGRNGRACRFTCSPPWWRSAPSTCLRR